MTTAHLRSLVALSVASCSATPTLPEQGPAPALTVTTPAPPAPSSASAVQPSDERPKAPTAQREMPERTAAPGSTRGTVSCGAARCKTPGEACFFDEARWAWTCRAVAPPTMAALESYDDFGLRCDDGLDCPDGETCCTTFAYHKRACIKRAEVPTTCQAEMCVADGARCPVGHSCTAKGADEGICKAVEGPATCAGKVPCPKDKPICVIADGKLACVADGSPEHQAAPADLRFHCTLQRDCHYGDTCQYVFGEIRHAMESYCGPYKAGFMGSLVCEPRPGVECNPPVGETAKLLPWLGVR